MDLQLFKRIFSDAHVVDIDLSRWDKALVVYVLADHLERTADGRKPIFAVDFVRVSKLAIELPHVDAPALPDSEHFQWMVDDFSIKRAHGTIDVELWGLKNTPRLKLSCSEVNIRPVELSVLDDLTPGWDEPSRPLARPGAEELAKLLGTTRRMKDRR